MEEMEIASMKEPQIYKVDLATIEGTGDFPCPKCGVTISPDDETEEVYTIVETKVINECLEEIRIRCKKCNSEICLTMVFPTSAISRQK